MQQRCGKVQSCFAVSGLSQQRQHNINQQQDCRRYRLKVWSSTTQQRMMDGRTRQRSLKQSLHHVPQLVGRDEDGKTVRETLKQTP